MDVSGAIYVIDIRYTFYPLRKFIMTLMSVLSTTQPKKENQQQRQPRERKNGLYVYDIQITIKHI